MVDVQNNNQMGLLMVLKSLGQSKVERGLKSLGESKVQVGVKRLGSLQAKMLDAYLHF